MAGYKTKQRDVILTYFEERPQEYITAKELISNTAVGEATVYRTLAKFVKEGVLKKVLKHDTEGTCYQYNGEAESHSCFQLRCMECGKSMRLDCGFAQDMERHVRAEHSFSIDCARTVIYGKCGICRGQYEKN